MKKILLHIFTILHILFLSFVVITPFTNINYILLLHSIFVPFMMIHWIANDNTCAITTAERLVKKRYYGNDYNDKNDCLTCKLIHPVFDFRKNNEKYTFIIYLITTGLWIISLYKLYDKYNSGEITNWIHFFNM